MTPTSEKNLESGQKRVYAVRVRDVEGNHPVHGNDWWRLVTHANPDGEWSKRTWAQDALDRAKASYGKGELIGHVFDVVVQDEPTLAQIDGAFISKWLRGDVVAINKVPAKLQDQYRDTLSRAALAAYRFGSSIWVNESFRTRAQQQARYDAYLAGGSLAAVPGHSPHEFGIGLDIPNARETPKLIKELRKLDLIDDVPSEKWHVTNHHRV